MLKEYKGTHGTCVSFAAEIARSGFKVAPGRRGTGAYFWAYNGSMKTLANGLAEAWWSQAKSLGKYKSADDQKCQVLSVKIQVEEASFLDLEAHDMKVALLNFLNESYARCLKAKRDELSIKAYDLFVELIQRSRNTKFWVIHVSVNPPQKEHWHTVGSCGGYPYELMGNPLCYVVKNNKCILIQS